jgi:hypothetical protein
MDEPLSNLPFFKTLAKIAELTAIPFNSTTMCKMFQKPMHQTVIPLIWQE